MDKFTTRKIIAGLVLLVVGLIVVYIKGDVPPNLLSLMSWLYASFVTGNAIQHVSDAVIASKANQ